MTAVITHHIDYFHFWCRQRQMAPVRNIGYQDSEGELYIPITKADQLRGLELSDVEIIGGIHKYDEIVAIAISRIRNK